MFFQALLQVLLSFALGFVLMHQSRLVCVLLLCVCGCLGSLCRGILCGSNAVRVFTNLPRDFGKFVKTAETTESLTQPEFLYSG